MITAVAAIFVVDGEIFTIKRQDTLRAFPGYHAFPGGKVDKGEELFDALVREIQEELDFDLLLAQKKGQVKKIGKFGVAETPKFNPIRFTTHYYKIELAAKPDFKESIHEVASSCWASSKKLLNDFVKGEMLMVPPVRSAISFLEKDPKRDTADVQFYYDEKSKVPMIEFIGGIWQLLVRSHTILPALYTNAFVIGDENKGRILVDPSPKDEKEFQKLYNTIKDFHIESIFLTHHHSDHNEQVDKLGALLNLPVKMSEDTLERIKKREGNNFFKKNKVEVLQEGDVVNESLKEEVVCFAVPGHDEGQLALAPRSFRWCLVGDLIQTIGTVVVAEPEGDMAKYFSSLEKIIKHAPRFIMPSHGSIMGGIVKLQQTLEHRKKREQQILTLHSQKKTLEEMVSIIYEGVDNHLLPYAKENVKSHLKKLNLS